MTVLLELHFLELPQLEFQFFQHLLFVPKMRNFECLYKYFGRKFETDFIILKLHNINVFYESVGVSA